MYKASIPSLLSNRDALLFDPEGKASLLSNFFYLKQSRDVVNILLPVIAEPSLILLPLDLERFVVCFPNFILSVETIHHDFS